MNKKLLLKWGVSLGILTAISVPVGVLAYLAKPKVKKYEVSLKSKINSRYLVTKLNTQQNKADFTKKDIFDVIDNIENKKIIAKYLGITDANNVITTIKSSNKSKYTNGLEKLIYDLVRAKKNGEELTLKSGAKYTNSEGGKEEASIKFDKAFLDMKYGTTLEQTTKIDIIATKLSELFFTTDKVIDIYILTGGSVVKFIQSHLDTAISNLKSRTA